MEQERAYYYVVSDTWMGRQLHIARTKAEAARNQYREMRQLHGEEVHSSQFRAWPVDDWPNLTNEEAFEWIRQHELKAHVSTTVVTKG
jgi:hypothetical protein